MSLMIGSIVIPMGNSASPPLLILRARAKVLASLLFPVPRDEKEAAPSRTIQIVASVSALLIKVGFPLSPDWAGKGGLRTA